MARMTPSTNEEAQVFHSVDDYLRHYGAKKDREAGPNEWYELGTEAAREAIWNAGLADLADNRSPHPRALAIRDYGPPNR